jgi:Mor family transcriptional regulator
MLLNKNQEIANLQILMDEKDQAISDILFWIQPLVDCDEILTSAMLKAIIAKCEAMMNGDF